LSDPDREKPEAPPPATWAGRERSSSEEGPAPEESADAAEPGVPEPEVSEALEAGEREAEPVAGEPEAEPEEEAPAEELNQDDAPSPAPSQATVEADTSALADREAAREAALAGLRARTAEHAAKQPTGAGAGPVESPNAAGEPAESPPVPETPPPPGPEVEEGPPRRGLWPRFLAGSFLIIVAMTTATAVSLLVYLKGIARGLGGLPSVRSQLQVADPGNPQTILILGSDERPTDESARSDTTILLRVATDQITVMSIPRDLKVNIPGHGIDRFNAAYSYGGPKLALTVVKQLTGLDNINHVVNVDFNGFADAVNAIGCVYVDVDHHYYHSNLGLAASEQYAEIDVPAGYQRMCGYNALQYVRYRHEDNDLVRAARQQEFLRDARQELPASKILADRSELIGILKRYVTSDIKELTDVVSLGKLFIGARGASVVQIDFPANLGGPDASYVTASESAIQEAVARFDGESTPAPEQQPAEGGKDAPAKKPDAKKPPPPPPLVDSSLTGVSGEQMAATLAATKTKSGKPMLDFPLYYPTKLAPGSSLIDDSRAFPIDGPGDEKYFGYKFVATLTTQGYTAYYGLSGTDWKDPPILDNPSEVKTIDGREYLLSWDGDRLRFVGWKTGRGSYWVDNTLLSVLTPGQLLGIAQTTRKHTG
jgi:polyisoprenyl-teichoic acid--peptidoglycan teichoic acid transferase